MYFLTNPNPNPNPNLNPNPNPNPYILHNPFHVAHMSYIVLKGIGDRHAQNILVDTVTAELVHIDFGIVFEQGKTLTTPETVPFRLTRYNTLIGRLI